MMYVPPIPREHGLWVVLAVAWLSGILIGGYDSAQLLLLGALLSLLIAFEAFRRYRRVRSRRSGALERRAMMAWLLGATASGVGMGVALLVAQPTLPILGIPPVLLAITFLLLERRRGRLIGLSAVAFASVSWIAPITAFLGPSSPDDKLLVWLGVVAMIYFASSSTRVAIRLKKEGGIATALITHALLLIVATLGAILTSEISLLIATIPAPLLLLMILLNRATYGSMTLKRIGLIESAAALWWLIVAV